jgi:hypothetical protein
MPSKWLHIMPIYKGDLDGANDDKSIASSRSSNHESDGTVSGDFGSPVGHVDNFTTRENRGDNVSSVTV